MPPTRQPSPITSEHTGSQMPCIAAPSTSEDTTLSLKEKKILIKKDKKN